MNKKSCLEIFFFFAVSSLFLKGIFSIFEVMLLCPFVLHIILGWTLLGKVFRKLIQAGEVLTPGRAQKHHLIQHPASPKFGA